MSLMENMDDLNIHQKQVAESAGSAKKMMESAYNDSLDAKVNDLKRAFEGLYEKILSSDSLKWLITEFTQLVTALSQVDGKTIAFTATVGGLVVVMSKLAELNKTLIAGEAVTGLSNFIAVLSGMKTVKTDIDNVTNATRAMQIAQVGLTEAEVAGTVGATGLSGAFTLLTNGIKGAITASLTFIATPLGVALIAITSVLGLAVTGFTAYKQHQEELTQQGIDLKKSIDGVNEALKSGDTKGASQSLDEARKQQKALEDLINKRKEMEALPEDNFYSKMGGANKAQSIEQITYKINEQIAVIKKQGLSVEETTGKIQELEQAQSQIVNQNIVDKIKSETQAQVEHRTNTEANTEEYKKYISTVQNLYSEYQNLSSQETLSSEQKQELASVVEQLQGKVSNLDVQMDANGKTYITNQGLIQDTISYYNSEGETVQILTQIKLADEKSNAQWQWNNTSLTYSQTLQRIQYYRSEVDEIQKLMQARLEEASAVISHKDADGNYDTSPDRANQEEHSYMIAKRASDARLKNANDNISSLQAGINSIDKMYTSMSLPSPSKGGGGASGDYMPSGGGSGSGKSGSKEKDYTEDIAKMLSDIKIDRYYDLNNVLSDVNNTLTDNKTIRDGLTEGSKEYQDSQLKDIEVYKQKQIALQNLNNEQKKEAEETKNKLKQYDFEFDANGKLINSQKKLAELQTNINNMGGSSEADKAKKQEYLDWLKEVNDDIKRYGDLSDDIIPKTANEWSTVTNEIKKTNEEMKKANEEILQNFYDKLAGDILTDMKKELTNATEEADKAEERAKKAIEDEKSEKTKYWEDRIQALQDELDALNNTEEDEKTKLKKLQEERALWLKDNSTEAGSHIKSLDSQIAETQKSIQKSELQNQIDDLNSQKEEDLKSYDERLKEKEDFYAEQKEKQEKANEESLLEEKAYAKAKELIQSKNQAEILNIIKSHAEEYKNAGSLLSKNFNDGYLEEYNKFMNSYGNLSNSTSNTSSGVIIAENTGGLPPADNTSSSSNSSSNEEVKVGDSIKVSNSNGDLISQVSNGTAISNSGTLSQYSDDELTTVGYDNGYFKIAKDGETIGWARRDDIARFKTGGRLGDLGEDGKFVLADSYETILNADDTKQMDENTMKLDEIYNSIKDSGVLLNQLSTIYQNPSGYINPVLSSNLNNITNGVINNNNNTTKQGDISIVQTFNLDAKTDARIKTIASDTNTLLKKELRSLGILTNK